jgi:hypothetical protein
VIVRCAVCSTPTVRGVCPSCLGDGAWHASVVLVIGLIVAAAVFHSCGGNAAGQDAPPRLLSATERVDVARCLVAESEPGPDYPAILAVLAQRSSSLAWSARHYCALFVTTHPSLRQRALLLLPGGPSSHIYRAHYRAALDAVDAWERGERPACAPDHFGDRLHDAQRARRAGWSVVDCGRTTNLYWRGGGRHRGIRAETARGGSR